MSDFNRTPTYSCKRKVGDKAWIVRYSYYFKGYEKEPRYKTFIELGKILEVVWNGHNWILIFLSKSFCCEACENSGDEFFYINDYNSKTQARNNAYIKYRGYGFKNNGEVK